MDNYVDNLWKSGGKLLRGVSIAATAGGFKGWPAQRIPQRGVFKGGKKLSTSYPQVIHIVIHILSVIEFRLQQGCFETKK